MAGRDTIPKIVFPHSSGANTLTFGYRVDDVRAYRRLADGSEQVINAAKTADTWSTGRWDILEVTVRFIPDSADGSVTGWTTANGWRDFLDDALDSIVFRWFPDKDGATYNTVVLMTNPLPEGREALGSDRRTLRLVMLDTGAGTLTTFDGY